MCEECEKANSQGTATTTTIPVTVVQYGWKCPQCGRVLSPWVQVCPCSVPATVISPYNPWVAPYTIAMY